ncbi:MAG: acyltransferase family protein [Desulfovibrio sp.]|nr:acyltransferase family protein [Desulfovibrio sp.]
MSAPAKPRLAYIDNVRIFLSMLVVAHHAGQPYGHDGWWLYQSPLKSQWIGLFFSVNEAFFMGLFFLIAGYFQPGSVDRKGPLKFVLDRLWRFGVPIAVMVLGITPIFMYYHDIIWKSMQMSSYLDYYLGAYLGLTAPPAGWTGPKGPNQELIHLWFIQNLFIYGGVYALYRAIVGDRDRKPKALPQEPIAPATAHWALITLVLWLTVSTYLIRIWKSVDDWKVLLGFWEIEFAHLPQYVTMFVLGIIAARRNWFERFPAKVGWVWLGIGVVCVGLCFARGVGFNFPFWNGGADPLALLRATWESLLCIGFAAGLLTLTRERFPSQGPLAKILSDSSFAVYIFHVPVVTLLQYWLSDSGLGPFQLFVVISILGIGISFPLAHFVLRRLPILGKAL